MVGKLRYLVAATVILSMIITVLFVNFLYSVFTPGDLVANAIFLVGAVVGGIVMFFTLNFLFLAITVIIVMWFVGRKIRKTFDALAERMEEQNKKKMK